MERGCRLSVRRLDDADALTALAPVYERLADAVDAPLSARWTWLSTWARTHPSWRPLAVVVDDLDGPVAAALLARRRRGPLVDVVALGHGQSDYARFPALDPEAGDRLADATAAALHGLGAPRRVRLDGFPRADPVLARLVAQLPGAVLGDGEGAPVVRLTPGVDPASTGRREARTMARRGHNRLATDGRAAELAAVTDPGRIGALLPELEDLHRGRDRALRGRSDLDDPEDRAFWYAACSEAAAAGTLEVSTLRVDGELAAYLLAFLDGPSYRVWDPRISPAHARYNPGHVLRAEVLSRVAADGRFTEFDWMRGEERYKLATTGDVVPLARVLAWSPAVLGALEPRVRRLLGRPDAAAAASSSSSSSSSETVAAASTSTGPSGTGASRRGSPRSAAGARVVEGALDAPALAVGTPPPEGRDLDLVLPADRVAPVTAALREAGFAPAPVGWLRWARADGRLRADVVEVGTAESWDLPPVEARWLWTGTRALPGHRWLHRPSPAASLLLVARRFGATGGDAATAWSTKAVRPAEDPAAWAAAAEHAPAWGVSRALAALGVAVSGGPPPTLPARVRLAREELRHGARRPLAGLRAVRRAVLGGRPGGRRRGLRGVVAVSGLDGAGKSSQADLLAGALADLGVPATTTWTRLSYRDWLTHLDLRIAAAVRLARAVRHHLPSRPDGERGPAADRADAPAPADRPVREFRQRHPSLTWCWAWVVTLDAVAEQRRTIRRAGRRGTVVVCDRYTLDSAAHLHALYGATTSVAAHVRAVRALAPRPLAAFLLRIDPAEAHRRKPEEFTVEALSRHAHFYDLEARADPAVTVLDGRRDVLDLAETIAGTVLAALHGDHPPAGTSAKDVAQAAVREYVAARDVSARVRRSIAEALPAYRALFERLGKA